jgi:small subunit ribosomal protein S21e
MQNSEGTYVDLYIPRKCQATNRLIDCKDTASVQITLNTDGLNLENQKDDQKHLTMVISGFVRTKGNSDAALNRFLYDKKVLSFY